MVPFSSLQSDNSAVIHKAKSICVVVFVQDWAHCAGEWRCGNRSRIASVEAAKLSRHTRAVYLSFSAIVQPSGMQFLQGAFSW